jgi:hypothetical protein
MVSERLAASVRAEISITQEKHVALVIDGHNSCDV